MRLSLPACQSLMCALLLVAPQREEKPGAKAFKGVELYSWPEERLTRRAGRIVSMLHILQRDGPTADAGRRSRVAPISGTIVPQMGAGKTASTLRAALSPCADRIQVAFVYGYVARSQPKAGSDIDLFVVGLVNFGDGRQAT